MGRFNKDKGFAVAGTILFHAIVVLLLFLTAFRTPLPLPSEEGVEVDLGMYNQGMGDIQPLEPEILPQSAPPQAVPTSSSVEENIATQDEEETPAIAKKPSKKPTEISKNTEEPKQVVNKKALLQGSKTGQNGGSEGITGQPGDQGNPNGLKGVKQYNGSGGNGNNISYSLGGRGAKSLTSPSNDFSEEGDIVVDIWVNREGRVIRAEIATRGTTIAASASANTMRNTAKNAALRSSFAADPSAPEEQKGTITYHFVFNH